MRNLKQRIVDRILEEKKARAVAHKVGLTNQAPTSKMGPVPKKEPAGSWKKKRARWSKYYKEHPELEAPAGELANMIDGLTPDGYDRKGRKVSFVERGESLTESSRLSSGRPIYIGRR